MKTIATIAALCALTACATGYQPEGMSGGFSEIPLAADAYQISVNGNGFTSSSRVTEMALLRGAELAKQNGYNYFVVRGVNEDSSVSSYTTPGSSHTSTYGTATAYGYGNTATAYGSSNSHTTYNAPQTHTIIKPGVDMVVQFIPDEHAQAAAALSVVQVFNMYGEKYGLEPPE
ncbi:hypothetical protein [Hyphomonas sp.]|uniref:CC0125/CC1285 family lipoprotein n=1 Tax=Hyphomonas sp. TaxID=87 RepID=UPI000E0413F3|nr:hypothetical protein [Hyphomonas sp.]RCL87199.1 MAG: hypothetical protein DBW63_08300 [Hyphomonas sp.]